MIVHTTDVSIDTFERETGWVVKPEGACRGGVCIPLAWNGGSTADARLLAERLGMALVRDEHHGLWALGPPTVTGRALETVEAPELVLPDLDGRPFRLSSLRGHKVVLVAWASW